MRLRLLDPKSLPSPDAGRVLSESQRAADPALAAEGWELRFIADAERMRESVDLYAQIGFDVRAEPVSVDEPQSDPECAPCAAAALRFFAIYTRKRGPAVGGVGGTSSGG